jgi:MOSC domain-containing protein YiiM/ferredoxin-NADP reductase
MGSVANTNPEIPIPSPTKLVSLRTGKLAPFGPLSIQSGIIKSPRVGRIRVTKLGLTDDEHDLTFHGGPDKAIHQYDSSHYPLWRSLYPACESFLPGGFGENLVADGFSETNICIGDRVRVCHLGDNEGALLEVSLPRQPCFKLNQRFGIKNFAPKTHELARTGWYYRVIEEGWIEEGMQIEIVERNWPRWTIERLHHFVHREQGAPEILDELVGIPEMGNECKSVFEKRIVKMNEDMKKKAEVWRRFRITRKKLETPRIMGFTFRCVDTLDKVEDVQPGSHVCVRLPNGLQRAYSVVGGTSECFELAIARDESSRGGSVYLHDQTKLGDLLSFGTITQSLSAASMASHHILIAGGIGITAFPAMMKRFEDINYNYELHYCVRSAEDVAFRKRMEELGDKVRIYDKSKGERLNVGRLLKERKWNSHVYICGPQRMIDGVLAAAKEVGMEDDEMHYETFKIDAGGDPFIVDVDVEGEAGKKGLNVGAEETLLQVLRKSGFEIGSSCEVGNCGTCRIGLKSGRVEHRGSALNEEEKGREVLSCVSRGVGHIIVEVPEA